MKTLAAPPTPSRPIMLDRSLDFFEHAPFLAGVSTLDGRLLAANRAMVDTLGYSHKAELLATDPSAFYPTPADRLPFLEKLMEVEQWTDVDVTWQRKDGSRLLLRTSGRFVEDGRDSRFEAIAHDVTVSRRRERDEEHERRAATVERFSGILAHNISNICTVVSLSAGLVKSELGPAHPSAPSVQEIIRAADNALEITDSLRSISGTVPGRLSDVDLDAMLADLGAEMRTTLPRAINLEMQLGSPNAWVRIDRRQLGGVIGILVDNAIDATADGGTITIETMLAKGTNRRDRSEVVVSVTDRGSGVDPQTLDKMFDPYFSTKPTALGKGLGLTVGRAIARQAEGSLSATSVVGRGTTATLRLPIRT